MPKTNKLKPSPSKKHKIRLLAYGDSPTVPSGFGTVMYQLMSKLANTGRYDIDVVGINERGGYHDPHIHPYRIYPARTPEERDFHGRSRFINMVRGGDPDLQPYWDIIFLFNDPFILEQKIPYFKLGVAAAIRDIQKTHRLKLPPDTWFRTIGYFPVDSPMKSNWVNGAIGLVDQPVVYNQYGFDQVTQANHQLDTPLSLNLETIPHGTDTAVFQPLSQHIIQQFKQDFFAGSVRPDTFVIINIARNSHRKDLVRTLQIFKEFKKRRPDSFLYLHTAEQGPWGSLLEASQALGLAQGKDWNFPEDYSEQVGFPTEILNGIYNAADVFLSTTQGEGWGLPFTEAMAAGCLVVAPAINGIGEILNTTSEQSSMPIQELANLPIRGIPLKAGSTSSEWINHGQADLERFRPLTNIDDAVSKLLWIYDHQSKLNPIINRARKYVLQHTWDHVVDQWERLIHQQYKLLEKDRKSNPTHS